MSKRVRCVVAVMSVALLSAGCGGDDKASDLSTESTASDSTMPDALATGAMVPAIQTVLDLGATSSADAPDLTICPLGDFDALVAKAPAEVTAAAPLDGALDTYVYQPANEPPHLQCGRGDFGAYTGLLPAADYKDELIRQLPDFVLTFDEDRDHLGGTIVRFCADPIGVDGSLVAFCEADWYDDKVWVGAFIYADVASAPLVEQWLVAILGDVVANVPQLAPTVQLVV